MSTYVHTYRLGFKTFYSITYLGRYVHHNAKKYVQLGRYSFLPAGRYRSYQLISILVRSACWAEWSLSLYNKLAWSQFSKFPCCIQTGDKKIKIVKVFIDHCENNHIPTFSKRLHGLLEVANACVDSFLQIRSQVAHASFASIKELPRHDTPSYLEILWRHQKLMSKQRQQRSGCCNVYLEGFNEEK